MGGLSYLDQYQSENTARSYRSALGDFFQSMYGEREPLENLAEKYFSEGRNYEEDVRSFFKGIKDKAPKTQKQKTSAGRIFLLENRVEFGEAFWRRLRGRIKGGLRGSPQETERETPILGKAVIYHGGV